MTMASSLSSFVALEVQKMTMNGIVACRHFFVLLLQTSRQLWVASWKK
jgi:hypothetical protein